METQLMVNRQSTTNSSLSGEPAETEVPQKVSSLLKHYEFPLECGMEMMTLYCFVQAKHNTNILSEINEIKPCKARQKHWQQPHKI